jgi:enolase-phosphatase E1
MSEPARTKLYLLDVEGTVAPLALTTDVLFPYARAHFEQFLWQNEAEIEARQGEGEDPLAEGSVWYDLMTLGYENLQDPDMDAPRIWPKPEKDAETGKPPRAIYLTPKVAIPKFLEYIYWLMDRDRKSTALKSLQGKVWKAGFESGELKGHLFPDVPDAFRRWSAHGRIAIYSSGSVAAQKLLFGHTVFGDLRPLISNYFDTRTGAKMESASYAAIAQAMEVLPGETVFFSDVVKELDAARDAGMQTRLVVREGNAPVGDGREHRVIDAFDGETMPTD